MKNGKLIASFLILILIPSCLLAFAYIPLWRDKRQRAKGLRASIDIAILDDKDFTKYYNFSGSGTKSNPYLIENLQLHSNRGTGIWIEKTTKHFVIRNCTITMSTTCIFLSEIASHTATIRDCFIKKNSSETNPYGYGISISYCSGVEIINNTCIGQLNSTNWLTSQNDGVNSGIRLWWSPNCRIIENKCTNWKDGVWLASSDNTLISNNNCSVNRFSGIYDDMSWKMIISSNICYNNSYGIFVTSTSFTTISYNNLSFNEDGLYNDGNGMTFYSNNCSFNIDKGMIFTGNTFGTLITENICMNNSDGIFIFEAWGGNNITKNNLIYNSHYGLVTLESYLLDIFQNNFIGNCHNALLSGHPQAYEELRYSLNNYWYDTINNVGNYWSDLIWDETSVYYIDGSNSTDLFPLENPVDI